MVLVRHEYLNSYTSDFYRFGISLQRSYISITSTKENAYVPVFLYDILLAKIAGSSKILLLPSRVHGGDVGYTKFLGS